MTVPFPVSEMILSQNISDSEVTDDSVAYSSFNEYHEDFHAILISSELSVRAKNVLSKNINSFYEFIKIDREMLFSFKHCGSRTVEEILEFQKNLRINLNLPEPQKKAETENIKTFIMSESIVNDTQFYDSVKEMLSKRGLNVIEKNEVDTIEKFMTLTPEIMLKMQNCGRNTVVEIINLQKKIIELIEKKEDGCPVFEIEDSLDLNSPYSAIEKWISEFSKKSEYKRAFMLRMGMLGNHPMTLEQIAYELGGITRERVRQIIDKIENKARYHVNANKLKLLIKKAFELVNLKGGRIRSEELVLHLLVHGSDGEMLRFATPFIDFLSTLNQWKVIGLNIDKNGVVFTNDACDLIQELSQNIAEIAYQNADEVICEYLWSTDLIILKKAVCAWYNSKHFTNKLEEISDTIISESLCNSEIRIESNRVYSYILWAIRHGKLFDAVAELLKSSKKPMHFTEVYEELKKYGMNDNYLTERNIHATIARNEDILLWDRGTFIHRTCVLIPHDLISEIERWILQKLRENVPFISVYGTFSYFQQKCIEANIPTEEALYSVLREVSHPLISYPKFSNIYLKRGEIYRAPLTLAIEQFIQESDKAVSLNELKIYVIDKLLCKDIQFNQIITQIPNTIRTKDGFIHTDLLNLDTNKINDVITHIRNTLKKEGHISIIKIFRDKKISCRILGLHDPKSLFSFLKLKFNTEFDLHYPQIRFLSEADKNKTNGIIDEIINFIKNKNTYCSIQELTEEFVDKLGYNENTVRYIYYTKYIFRYSKDSVIHIDSIEWNEEKQRQLETSAANRFDRCERIGRCYGLIRDMIESDSLPNIGNKIYWTPYLLADLLISHGRFAILGSEKNAFIPIPNQFGIENFEDLVYEILKKEHDGSENLNSFANKLRESGIIRKNISPSMLGESRKVEIIRNEILLKGLLS